MKKVVLVVNGTFFILVVKRLDILRDKFGDGWDRRGNVGFLLDDRSGFGEGTMLGDEIRVGFLCGTLGLEARELFLFSMTVERDDVENNIPNATVELRLPLLKVVFG